ncbi:MAG: ParB/RepB/Spo0J family partition protein [Oscillospiraceae bacterium]|nr:ParB/RepB/Spo0J family partition protein [Oscillospiraceae bacterium]
MALGKGYDDLFADNTSNENVLSLRVSQIEPNKDQPRNNMDNDALNELAESIRENGIIQPIVVRPLKNGLTYQIIAGERRWRASKIAGLLEVPVIVRDVDDAEMNKLAMIENIQREDLDPVEEAMGYKRLSEAFGMTHDELSRSVGKSRSYITNMLRILTMPDRVLGKLSSGEITIGHAKALLSLTDKDACEEVLDIVLSKHLNVRQTEKLVGEVNSAETDKDSIRVPEKNKYYVETALSLKERLGRNVKIKGSNGKGNITLEFYSDDDLARITDLLASLSE